MANMLSLKDLQAGFAAQAIPATGKAPAGLVDCVLGNGLAPAARLRVHANNTRLTLTDALSKTFPVIAALTGGEFFAALAAHYIEADPPRSAALIDWGTGFAEFLAGFQPAQQLPYLPDMARLEWAVSESFNAADNAPATADSLNAMNPAELADAPLPLHSAAHLLKADWPVDDIWAAHQPGGLSLD
ncbi:MAG: putative DNA-binding domain-containing protein, partial [Alphaproteobacteria bacterium]